MSIEIIVGLPHLANGPILERAKLMQQPMLVSANTFSRWRTDAGWPEWTGWRTGQLKNAVGLKSLDLDSAGYVLMSRYKGFPWSIADYMALASSFPFRRIAAADYCCEHQIARDREEVLDRISRTIATNRECRSRAVDLGIADRLMPVLQGRCATDYERCADALAWSMLPGTIVGIGSMCRRDIHGSEGLVAIVEHLDRTLPEGVGLHLFGVKGTALPWLQPFAHRVASIDSQAWGTAARRDAHRRGVPKTDRLSADHMERWTSTQLDRLAEAPRHLDPAAAVPVQHNVPSDPWEAAIVRAREQIRDLIESGDLSHDEVTAAWVEAWAADLYHGDRQAA
ncbi:DUF7221 family queuine tRNA-ribosyltransferase-like protein [Sphingomonas lacusdianchii]|uniref:deazapurine DNA modification protein DpdA family protein n=1 Tax=Sphingomonas lacusdianchii TaxID=2917992 RepID=UPI001F5794A1|nr:hypothetical protein [Sphingomonas sp. JXJ CY 53]